MDAHAHLLSLGWAGTGHALDSRPKAYTQTGKRGLDYNPKQLTNTGVGLVKPLMISQRKERFGIGRKDPKHEPAAGNEWWLKGLEAALGNIGKSDSERSGTATPIQAQVNGQKHRGLYGFFVRGQQMEGTIGEELLRKSKKRKSDQISGSLPADTEAGLAKVQDSAEEFAQAAVFLAVRDKDEKRRKRAEKAGALEEFRHATQYFEARSTRKKRRSDAEVGEAEVESHFDGGTSVREETKEERRHRRRKRKEEKAARKGLDTEGQRTPPKATQDDTSKRKRKDERSRDKHLPAERKPH